MGDATLSYNGSGTFNINSTGQPVVTGTVISSSVFNALTADLATGLSTCITKDGQTTVTANIPMNSFKFTNLAAGTAAGDSVRVSQLQAGSATSLTVTGTNTYAATASPALTAYTTGNTFSFVVPNSNTSSCTLNIDSLGAKAITRDGTTALVSGDLVAGSEVLVVYDGTQFQVLNSNSKTNWTVSNALTLSAGTANGVAYLNGSKVLTTGSALVFDGTNLGIGTSSPGQKLTVQGGLNVTSSATLPASQGSMLFSYESAVNRCYMGDGTGYSFAFSKRASSTTTDLMTLTDSGNLGLGVTPSAWSGGYRSIDNLIYNSSYSNNGGIAGMSFNAYNNGTNWIYKNTTTATRFETDLARFKWFTAPSGTAGNAITFTQAMTLDASGNLLLGTTSGNGLKLDFSPSSSQQNGITYVNSSPNSYTDIYGCGTSGAWQGAIRFFTSNNAAASERARITSGGDLLVPAAGSGSTGRISVRKDTGVPLAVSNEGVTGTLIEFSGNGSGALGSITHNGTNVAYNTSSDYRLKDNPQPLTGSGAFIDALKPKTWEWKADGSKGVGFIAHEVAEVSPASVVGEKDAVDADGKPVYQAMEYGSAEFIANIVAELQSLRARVAQLESK